MKAKTVAGLLKEKSLRSSVVALQQSPGTATRLSSKTSSSPSSTAAVVGSVKLRAVNVSSLKQPHKLRPILPATVQVQPQGGRPSAFSVYLFIHFIQFSAVQIFKISDQVE